MPVELYNKAGFGRRLRKITQAAAAALSKINQSFYTSIAGYGSGAPAPAPAAPTKTADPTVAGGTAVGVTLTVTPGTYAGVPAPTITRQWKNGGADIVGETGLTLDTTGLTAGDSITCVETATNASGAVTGTSAAVVLT